MGGGHKMSHDWQKILFEDEEEGDDILQLDCQLNVSAHCSQKSQVRNYYSQMITIKMHFNIECYIVYYKWRFL
jgi:hypothetical protein